MSKVRIPDNGFKGGLCMYDSPKRALFKMHIFSIHIHHSWNTQVYGSQHPVFQPEKKKIN